MPTHHCYVEVFAGAAWMFFKKPESEIEIINDINKDLITLYRVVKHHLEEFVRYTKYTLISRDEYKRCVEENPDTLTDIQRSVRFYYLLKNTFASKLAFDSFAISSVKRPRLNLLRIEEDLSDAHIRLSQTYIENLPYEKLIPRFDKSETFFYIDPPYYNCEQYYGKGIFSKDDFIKLRDLLLNLQGKFILSINDVPEIREIFKDFYVREVATSYSAGGGNKKKQVTELLYMNYVPETT